MSKPVKAKLFVAQINSSAKSLISEYNRLLLPQ